MVFWLFFCVDFIDFAVDFLAFHTSASNCLEDRLRNVLSTTLNLKHLLTYSPKESGSDARRTQSV